MVAIDTAINGPAHTFPLIPHYSPRFFFFPTSTHTLSQFVISHPNSSPNGGGEICCLVCSVIYVHVIVIGIRRRRTIVFQWPLYLFIHTLLLSLLSSCIQCACTFLYIMSIPPPIHTRTHAFSLSVQGWRVHISSFLPLLS